MAKVCSSHNLSVLEELNTDFKMHCLALRVLLESAEDNRYTDKQNEFNGLIWASLEMLEQCSDDFSVWESCLRTEQTMNP